MEFSKVQLHKIFEGFGPWLRDSVWETSTLIQVIIIAASLLTGLVVYRSVRPILIRWLDSSDAPAYIKGLLGGVKSLIIYIVAVPAIFVMAHITVSFYPDIRVGLAIAVMKLFLTWIAIRIVLQFISNSALRNIFALFILTIATLSIFGVLDETTAALDALGFNIGSFRLSALVIFKAALSLFIFLYVATLLGGFFERRILRTRGLSASSQVLIIKIVRIILIVMAVLIAVGSSGVDMSIFAVFSGAVGLGVGFGLQKVASNLFSGILLLSDKSINPGDIIELENGTFGWVNRMAARYTEIVTRDNKSYLIPNEDFVTQRIVNWSHGNRLIRLEVTFGVEYKSDPRQIIEIAKAAAVTPERVVKTPEPVCWITGFGDSSINFSLRFWIKDAEGGITNVKGEVFLALWDAFHENDIQIPFPQLVVYLHGAEDT